MCVKSAKQISASILLLFCLLISFRTIRPVITSWNCRWLPKLVHCGTQRSGCLHYKNSNSLTVKNGSRVGVAVAEFQHPGQSGFLDPNHGVRFDFGLSNTVDANALLTLCEGFTDYEEDAAMWRARNMDSNGNSLSYSQTLYDYPNQRLNNILRKHSNWPFPPELKFEAEACDTFGGATGGNGKANFYRNGLQHTPSKQRCGGGGWCQL